MRTADGSSEIALDLLVWLSPAFPVGSFAYSHGLETAVEDGDIHDAASLQAWLRDLLEHGSARTDTILAGVAARAAGADIAADLRDANDLALALCPGRERRLETDAMGQAFAGTIRGSWPAAACAALPMGEVAYPVAFGAACGVRRLALKPCLAAYALAFVQTMVSAAVRLGPIGQTEGQNTTAALVPVVQSLAAFAADATIDDVGGCALRSDLAALRHETLYSRLFRS